MAQDDDVKIVLLGGVMSFGGVEQHMLTLALALRRLGHDAQIMGLCNAGGFDQIRGWTDPEGQVPVHWAEGWPLNAAGARQMLLDLAPDVVNVQLPVSPAAIPEPADFAVVGTAHGVSSLQGRIPDCRSIVALDKRILPELRSFAGQSGIPVQAVCKCVDLKRFKFRDDAAKRNGAAYFGRVDQTKLGVLAGWVGCGTMDIYCDAPGADVFRVNFPLPQFAIKGPARAEDVLYRYRIVAASGTGAIEAMACGALVLAAPLDAGRLAGWRDWGYMPDYFYYEGWRFDREDGVREVPRDAARLRQDGIATETARLCRQWVERWHDVEAVAKQFVEVYEEAMN